MLNTKLKLNSNFFRENASKESLREAFGEAILETGSKNKDVVVLCADLKESVKVDEFEKEFPDRFIEIGIAEQNMAGIAAGLALSGKIPFITSHAIFSPSRNWDQIRMAICISKANVKIASSHAGFSNGRDGSVAESLEDIALMRVLPNITIVHPIDGEQTKKSVRAVTEYKGPIYLRYSKAKVPSITAQETPFEIGKAYVLKEGSDATIFTTGPITNEALFAAQELFEAYKFDLEVIACPTIKPLDKKTILESAKKTNRVFTLEEHQINGGFGEAVASLLASEYPIKTTIIGVEDTFGESGSYEELLDKYKLNRHYIIKKVLEK